MTSNRIVYATSTTSAARKAEREQRQAEAAARQARNLNAISRVVCATTFEGHRTLGFLPIFPEDVA